MKLTAARTSLRLTTALRLTIIFSLTLFLSLTIGSAAQDHTMGTAKPVTMMTGPVSYTHLTLPTNREV